MTQYAPLPLALRPEGHLVHWSTWDDVHHEVVTILWENEGYTVSGLVGRERVQYVLRLSATWQVRQFLMFRDLEEPDLWLATDGSGRWGEMNGAHRTELDGCYDVALVCTPLTLSLPVRRLPLLVGHTAEIPVAVVDTETLDVRAVVHRYERITSHRWRVEGHVLGTSARDSLEFEVDEHGLVLDVAGHFRRSALPD